MKVALYTINISPHQLPLAIEIQKVVGLENFRYVSICKNDTGRGNFAWNVDYVPAWVIYYENPEARQWLESAEVLFSGERDVKLFERRTNKGLKSFYAAERWFKPPWGMLRLLYPRFFFMAWRMAELIKSEKIVYLPMGIHAAKDMARLCGFLNGDWRCVFHLPRLDFEQKPMGKIWSAQGQRKQYCTEQMRMWGYFVETGQPQEINSGKHGMSPLKILWAGRMLAWKKVDTLIQAVKQLLTEGFSFHLQIVGTGPEEACLKRLAGRHLCEDSQKDGITFSAQVPIHEVRHLMQQADVYVLPSNGYEGWGVVVNEAMTEGCCVVGTRDAGSPATMIEDGVNGLLFDAEDVQELVHCLKKLVNTTYRKELAQKGKQTIDVAWSPVNAAKQFLAFCENQACCVIN